MRKTSSLTTAKVMLKRDTHASRKEAKLMENKNLARNRKEIIAKAQFMQSGATDSQIDPNQMQKKS